MSYQHPNPNGSAASPDEADELAEWPSPSYALTPHHELVANLIQGLGDGVDAGNGDVLDNVINEWRTRWVGEVLGHGLGRMNLLDVDLVPLMERLADRQVEYRCARTAFDHAQAGLAAAKSALMGDPAGDGSGAGRSQQPTPRAYGYASPALISGRPLSTWLHYAVLAVAAVADLVAFYQVLVVLFRYTAPILAWPIVAGFAAISLYVMHATGTALRDAKAHPHSRHRWIAVLGTLAWAAVGVTGFVLRQVVEDTSNPNAFDTGGGGGVPVLATATVFLVLFVATGVTALVGAYLTHNPLIGEYRKALRGYRKAATTLRRAHANLMRAVQAWLVARDRHARESKLVATLLRGRASLAEELRHFARYWVARRHTDPAVTDGVTERPNRAQAQPPPQQWRNRRPW